MSDLQSISVKDLKPLAELYPRREASKPHVASLANALRAGAQFPPLIVEAGTLAIVDGYHRWSAYSEVNGQEFLAPCDVRTYGSRLELFEDAIAENARHGLRFTREDQGHCIVLAARLKLTAQDLAPVLRLTPTVMRIVRCEYLEKRTVRAKPDPAAPKQRRPEKAKKSPRPKNVALWSATAHINNLALLLESESLDAEYGHLSRTMAQLKAAVSDFLGKAARG